VQRRKEHCQKNSQAKQKGGNIGFPTHIIGLSVHKPTKKIVNRCNSASGEAFTILRRQDTSASVSTNTNHLKAFS